MKQLAEPLNRLLFCLIVSLSPSWLAALEISQGSALLPLTATLPTPYRVFNSSDGLPQNTVYALAHGLWVGASAGPYRCDLAICERAAASSGLGSTVWQGLPENHLYRLMQSDAQRGPLLIGTASSGIARPDPGRWWNFHERHAPLLRMGGEEFLLPLPIACDDDETRAVHAVLNAISSAPFNIDGVALKVSGSHGALRHSFNPSGPTPMPLGDILRVVDQAPYRAKAAGRNCGMLGAPADASVTGSEVGNVAWRLLRPIS